VQLHGFTFCHGEGFRVTHGPYTLRSHGVIPTTPNAKQGLLDVKFFTAEHFVSHVENFTNPLALHIVKSTNPLALDIYENLEFLNA
jgi:hypothetical protein